MISDGRYVFRCHSINARHWTTKTATRTEYVYTWILSTSPLPTRTATVEGLKLLNVPERVERRFNPRAALAVFTQCIDSHNR